MVNIKKNKKSKIPQALEGQKLNKVTINNKYPLPSVDALFDQRRE